MAMHSKTNMKIHQRKFRLPKSNLTSLRHILLITKKGKKSSDQRVRKTDGIWNKALGSNHSERLGHEKNVGYDL